MFDQEVEDTGGEQEEDEDRDRVRRSEVARGLEDRRRDQQEQGPGDGQPAVQPRVDRVRRIDGQEPEEDFLVRKGHGPVTAAEG
ncbi:MAG TPA: hypothetical protein VGS23_07805 [Thermoplasmata archaeon]|nr:hypothetical protein [Thermoplasmata archaeon]